METETKNEVETTTEAITPVVEQTVAQIEEIDYEKAYQDEKKRREKAEYTLYKTKKEEKALKREEELSEEEPQEEKEAIPSDLDVRRIAREEASSVLKGDIIEREIAKRASSIAEAKLIRLKYDRAIVKSGFSESDIIQDVEDAHFLANKPRYLKKQGELEHALVAKNTLGNSSLGTNQDKKGASEDISKSFTKNDWDFMKKRGWSDEQIRKALPIK